MPLTCQDVMLLGAEYARSAAVGWRGMPEVNAPVALESPLTASAQVQDANKKVLWRAQAYLLNLAAITVQRSNATWTGLSCPQRVRTGWQGKFRHCRHEPFTPLRFHLCEGGQDVRVATCMSREAAHQQLGGLA